MRAVCPDMAISYRAYVAQNPDATQAPRDILRAVSDTQAFAFSRTPERIDVPNSEATVAPDAPLIAAGNAIKERPGREAGLPRGVRTARTFAQLDLIDQSAPLMGPTAVDAGRRLFHRQTTKRPNARARATRFTCTTSTFVAAHARHWNLPVGRAQVHR
jgi:hypothetical protein